MLRFKQFLIEEKKENTLYPPYSLPITSPDIKSSIPTIYSDEATGIQSFFYKVPQEKMAYWGYGITDKDGNLLDTPEEGVPAELRSARSKVMRSHMSDFLGKNPGTKITYQTNPGPHGEANHQFFQGKMKTEMQNLHGPDVSIERVETNPLKSSSAIKGTIAGIIGTAVGELAKPAAEKSGATDWLADKLTPFIPDFALGSSPAEKVRERAQQLESEPTLPNGRPPSLSMTGLRNPMTGAPMSDKEEDEQAMKIVKARQQARQK